MSEPPRYMLVPGLGADERLFDPQRAALPRLEVPAWIPPRRRETLADYARRMAGTVAPGGRLVLGGVSLGGMIAYEMARHLRPPVVVLIASCAERRGIRPVFRALRPLAVALPAAVFEAVKPLAAPVLRLTSDLGPEGRAVGADMFRRMDPRFVKWAVEAILGWRPEPLEAVPVLQIHGAADHMIPARRVEADQVIPGGRHLINMTHPEEVNRFLKRAAEEAAGGVSKPRAREV